MSCFAFVFGRRSLDGERRSRVDLSATAAGNEAAQPPSRQLPPLRTACREAASSDCGCRLPLRCCVVGIRLLPVALRILVDSLRRGGPRYAEANTRRMRLALESLGPAFVKLGQAAAAREDVLSDVVAAELRKLCDQVPPFPDDAARRVIREELGALAPTELGPVVAAASLGQVYRVTVDGSDFALKVQRPGLARQLAVDVVVLKGLARFVRFFVRLLCRTPLDPAQVVENWAQTLWFELDYTREAASMQRMRRALVGKINGLEIPNVCERLSSLRVLASEWIVGAKVTENPKLVTTNHITIGVETFIAMIFNIGTVHADPHAGNVLVTGEKGLCLLDFGMVVDVPEAHRIAWARCIVHLVRREHNAVLDDLIQIGFFPADCPRSEILPVMSQIWTQLVLCGSDIQKRKVAVQMLYKEILTFVRRFEFSLPDYYVALARALVTLEGIALAADCDFDIFKAAFPAALRHLSTLTASQACADGSAKISSCAKRCSVRSKPYVQMASKTLTLSAVFLGVAAIARNAFARVL
eukprot:TRINITY_DN14832_c0_g1_i1.p1 TRINITY_DN14832_c0_g1~~TRINITY_DN14832_c0_g1_i1.p1  ORF type:complete len:528 (+),score=114.85 TRINITY_DN14832_c0_g1_i1:145-1728(+)